MENRALVAAVPRLVAHLEPLDATRPFIFPWGDTILELPSPFSTMSFVDVFTGARLMPANSTAGGRLRVADLFHSCPVALLFGSPEGAIPDAG